MDDKWSFDSEVDEDVPTASHKSIRRNEEVKVVWCKWTGCEDDEDFLKDISTPLLLFSSCISADMLLLREGEYYTRSFTGCPDDDDVDDDDYDNLCCVSLATHLLQIVLLLLNIRGEDGWGKSDSIMYREEERIRMYEGERDTHTNVREDDDEVDVGWMRCKTFLKYYTIEYGRSALWEEEEEEDRDGGDEDDGRRIRKGGGGWQLLDSSWCCCWCSDDDDSPHHMIERAFAFCVLKIFCGSLIVSRRKSCLKMMMDVKVGKRKFTHFYERLHDDDEDDFNSIMLLCSIMMMSWRENRFWSRFSSLESADSHHIRPCLTCVCCWWWCWFLLFSLFSKSFMIFKSLKKDHQHPPSDIIIMIHVVLPEILILDHFVCFCFSHSMILILLLSFRFFPSHDFILLFLASDHFCVSHAIILFIFFRKNDWTECVNIWNLHELL